MCSPQSAFISVEGVCLCAQVCACFIKSKECIQVLSKTFLKNALYQIILFWLCFSGLSFANCVMEQGNNMFQIISSTVCYRNCDFRTEQSCQRTDGQFPKKNNLFLYVHRYKNNYIFLSAFMQDVYLVVKRKQTKMSSHFKLKCCDCPVTFCRKHWWAAMKTYWMIHSLCGLWAFLSAMLATATWNWINLSECSKCKREREEERKNN